MCALFSRKSNSRGEAKSSDSVKTANLSSTALTMVSKGNKREISFGELTLSNNMAQQALTRVLIKKNIITAEELLEAMQEVRRENYQPSEKDPSKK